MARYYGAALAALAVAGAQDVSRECKMKCNEALGNLPQALDCRDWRMMLPRPKVGKACTQAYDDAAFAVCTARCEGREPPRKEALTGNFCREYTAKTPKPTMGKSCRSGYAKGFDKGLAIDVGRSAPEPATLHGPCRGGSLRASAPPVPWVMRVHPPLIRPLGPLPA